MSGQIPDVTKYTFRCLACDWQVQAGPKARSECGGAIALYRAIAEVLMAHQTAEHPGWTPSDAIGAGAAAMVSNDGKQATGGALAEILPRWWVDKS